MHYDMYDVADTIPDKESRLRMQYHLSYQSGLIDRLQQDNEWLRSQVTLALRSIKFDLHPEIRLDR